VNSRGSTHRINLIPREARSSTLEVPAQALPVLLVATLLVVAGVAIQQNRVLKRLNLELDQVAARQQEVTRQIEALNQQKDLTKDREKQMSTLQQLLSR